MSKSQKQQTDRDKSTPQPTAREASKKSAAWSQHEHVAPPVQTQAQKLLDDAGSPELAHLAIEQAAEESVVVPPGLDLNPLAERWGFATWHEMLAASINLASSQGDAWWATPIGNRGWVVWNERDRTMSDPLATLDQAREFIATAGGAFEE